jgi:transposase
MATIRKQKVGKYTYWQIVESKRINGKPRPFVLMHLGTAEKLLQRLSKGPLKRKIKSWSHGAVFALWNLAQNMEIVSLFKSSFSPQKRHGLSVGSYLLMGGIHRAVKPGSKRAFGDWAKKTTLPQIVGFDPMKIESQDFWDQMDTVTEEQMEQVEKDLTIILKENGLLSPSLLFYDTTNFFTFIDSNNKKTKLAKRGKNKQKRNDLRQFGLAQVVTKEFLIPICSEVYEGNQPDSNIFIPQVTRLRKKLEELHYQIEEFTIVFDKGNNSKKNFAELDKMEFPYVASLTPSHHEDLINIPIWRYYTVAVGEKKIRCYRTKKLIWGKERTVVLYLSEILKEGQIRGLEQELGKKYQQLQKLKDELNSPKAKPRDLDVLKRKIKNILLGERGVFLIDVEIKKRRRGFFDISWELDELAYDWVTKVLFGKRLLVTCRQEWTEEEIIAAYQGQSHVERIFKHFKNPYHHLVRRQYHWTDQKIKVHTFLCLSGFLLSQLLWKKAQQAGKIFSIEKLLDRLSEVRMAEIITLYDLKSKPVKETQLEEMDEELEGLWNAVKE